MNATEVVPCNVQGNGSLEVIKLLAEAKCQSREPAKASPNAQVRPLHIAPTNVRNVRLSNFGFRDRCDDFGWSVPYHPGAALSCFPYIFVS